MKILTLASVLTLLPVALPARAVPEELKRERLPADVQFVLHLDVENLLHTELGRILLEFRHSPDSDLEDLDELEAKLGVDFLRDVYGVTLYQLQGEEEPTVALFATSLAVEGALVALREQPGFQELERDGIPLMTIDADDESMFVYAHPPQGDRRVLVVTGSSEKTLAAARVLRGETSNHAAGTGLLKLAPAAGSFLYVAAGDLPAIAQDTPASQVFGLAQGIHVDLGEAGGFLTAHLAVLTELPERARQVADVLQGLVSMGSLALMGEAPAVLEVLRELRVSTQGNEVAVDFRFASRRLTEILQSLDQDEDQDAEDPFVYKIR